MKDYLKNNFKTAAILCVMVCGLASGMVLSQRPAPFAGGFPHGDPLAHLKRALSDAGAPALTSAQEDQLKALITSLQTARQQAGPNTALEAAHAAYEKAILAGDNTAAQAQADIIATESANVQRKILKDNAKFEIDVLNVLKTNDNQVGLLSQRFGTEGLARLLGSLAGPGGFGHGFGPGHRPGQG